MHGLCSRRSQGPNCFYSIALPGLYIWYNTLAVEKVSFLVSTLYRMGRFGGGMIAISH